MSTDRNIRISRVVGPMLLVLLIMLAGKAFAQPDKDYGKDKQEKLKALKVSYLTGKLNLTTAEAEKFWPVYNEYEEAKFKMFAEEHKELRKDLKEADDLSDAELDAMIDKYLSSKQKEADLEKKYYAKFRAILPPSKVTMLISADHDFKREVLKQMRECKGDGGANEPKADH